MSDITNKDLPDNTKEVSEKRARSLRLRVGVPVSTGLCKRRAKPESGPRATGRRSSEGNNGSEGNSSAHKPGVPASTGL